MGHHSSEGESPFERYRDEIDKAAQENRQKALDGKLRQILEQPLIGATGTFPEGKLTPSDEGAIQFAIGVKDGQVCIDFGTPCKWVGMSPSQAVELASSLITHAKNAASGTGSILTLNL